MNDKIKVLAEQSGIGWDDKYHWYVGAPQLQKYTEAVIRECLEQCEKARDIKWTAPVHHDENITACIILIKEHFGIKP